MVLIAIEMLPHIIGVCVCVETVWLEQQNAVYKYFLSHTRRKVFCKPAGEGVFWWFHVWM